MVSLNNTREEYLDIAKGIGIFLVIWAHCMVPRSIWIYSFHLPLFFYVSGLLYSKKDYKEFFVRKVKRLLIPFFFFSICGLFLFTAADFIMHKFNSSDFFSALGKIFLGIPISQLAPMWFLTASFMLAIIYRTLDSFVEKKFLMLIVVILLALAGFYIDKFLPSEYEIPYKIDVAFTALPFFFVGHLVRNSPKLSKRTTIASVIVLFVVWIGTTYLNSRVLGGENVSMHRNVLGNIILFYISAFSGVWVVINLCKLIHLRLFVFLSINSLVLMCTHYVFCFPFIDFFGRIIHNNFIMEIFIAILITAICTFFCLVCKKIFPQMSGYK